MSANYLSAFYKVFYETLTRIRLVKKNCHYYQRCSPFRVSIDWREYCTCTFLLFKFQVGLQPNLFTFFSLIFDFLIKISSLQAMFFSISWDRYILWRTKGLQPLNNILELRKNYQGIVSLQCPHIKVGMDLQNYKGCFGLSRHFFRQS